MNRGPLHKPLIRNNYFNERQPLQQQAVRDPLYLEIGLKFAPARSLIQLMENNVRNSQDV